MIGVRGMMNLVDLKRLLSLWSEVLEALWPRSKTSNVLFSFFLSFTLSAVWAGYSFSCGNRCGSGVLGYDQDTKE